MPEDYEIVSYEELSDLKKQIEGLRSKGRETVSMSDLKKSIDTLNNNLTVMMELFSQAHSMMNADSKETQALHGSIGPLMQKIDTLLEQNQTVAKGIITVSDMVNKKLVGIDNTKPAKIANQQAPPPRMPQTLRSGSQQSYSPSQGPSSIPPLSSRPPVQQGIQPLPQQDNMHSHGDLNMSSNIPPLPRQQPGSLSPGINPPPKPEPKKKPLFSFK